MTLRHPSLRQHSSPRSTLRQLAVVLGLALASSAAFALSIDLPQETATYRNIDMPGYLKAQQNCLICHSAQYPSTQPPGLSHSFWEAEVKKMKATYGATFPDEDIPALTDYLTKAYGADAAK